MSENSTTQDKFPSVTKLSDLSPDEFIKYLEKSSGREMNPYLAAQLKRKMVMSLEDYERYEKLVVQSDQLLEELERKKADFPMLGGLLWRGAVHLLIADSSAGKSVMCHRLCRSLANKEPFLGLQAEQPYTVLYIDLENPEGSKHLYVSKVGTASGWSGTRVGVSETDAQWLLRRGLTDVVVVDNLVNLYDIRDENDNAEMIRHAKELVRIAQETGVCILILHNTGKGERKDSQRGRGAQGLIDRIDLKFDLMELKEGWQLKITKSRFGNVGEKFLYNWTDDYNYEIIKHTLAAEPEQIKLMHEMVRYVMDTSLKAVKREDIFKALDFDPRSTQGQMCKRALRLAVDKGYLWKVVGKPGYYSLPPAESSEEFTSEGAEEGS